jgi:phasin
MHYDYLREIFKFVFYFGFFYVAPPDIALRLTLQLLCGCFISIACGRHARANRSKKPDERVGRQLAGFHIPPQRMSVMTGQYQATNATDAPQALRDVAENATAQVKENFEKMSAATGEAANLMKNTYATSFKGAQEYSTKVLEFANTNLNASFEHAKKLLSVKSPAEFFALSNDHVRQQFEILSRQTQELAAIAQKMTAAATESVKAGVHKAV